MRASFSGQSIDCGTFITSVIQSQELRDLSSLEDDKWIADTVINDWADYMIYLHNAYDSILYVPTFLYRCLLDKNLDPRKTGNLIKYLANNKAMNKDIVLVGIPATSTGKHWMLGVIMLNTKRITILDPMVTTDYIENNVYNNLLRITLTVHNLAAIPFDPDQYELFYAIAIPRQNNNNDCGVCVCNYIFTIVAKKHMVKELDLHEGRNRIRYTLSKVKEIEVPKVQKLYSPELINSLANCLDQVFEVKYQVKTFWRINENSSRAPKVPSSSECADQFCAHYLSNIELEQSFCCQCRRWYHNFCMSADPTAIYPICSNCSNSFYY